MNARRPRRRRAWPPTAPGRVDPVRDRRAGAGRTTACATARWSVRPGWSRRAARVGRAARRRQRAGRRRRGARGRRRRRRGDATPWPASPGSRTGCSWSASAAACGTTTTRRRPTRTPPSARCAGFEHVVLIAGGRNKGLDLGGLRAQAEPGPGRRRDRRGRRARSRPRSPARSRWSGRDSMREAVRVAAGAAPQPGDAVLLSPACASFDWYDELRRARRRLRPRGRR